MMWDDPTSTRRALASAGSRTQEGPPIWAGLRALASLVRESWNQIEEWLADLAQLRTDE